MEENLSIVKWTQTDFTVSTEIQVALDIEHQFDTSNIVTTGCVCVSVFVICSSRFDCIHFQSQSWCAAIPAPGCAPARRPTLWLWAWAL